jgi:hypothetical protein
MLFKPFPLKYKVKAMSQWISVISVMLFAVIAGLFMCLLACATYKKMKNAFGEIEQEHSEKYKALGSSGKWEYWASNIPFIRLWSNYEDGDLGEPSGKQSVRCKGKERTFWNRYKWNALRNPFNMGKRTIPFFHCLVDDCDIEWYGDKYVSDKNVDTSGWQFVIATHRKTGKKYYGYYEVKVLDDNHVSVKKYGFKIKPSHADEVQDADDKDKAFTFRWQPRSEVN